MRERVFEMPFQLAVSRAVVSVATKVAVAAKMAVLSPPGTVTDAGTLKLGLLLASAAGSPPVGAGEVRVTVQVELAGVTRELRLQVRPLRVGGKTVTVAMLVRPPAL